MQTITVAPPKRSWFSLVSWAILLAVLVVSWKGAEMAPLTLIQDHADSGFWQHGDVCRRLLSAGL